MNKEKEKDIPTNGTRKQAGTIILVFSKIDFKPKLIRGGKEVNSISIKGSIHQENITIINTLPPNTSLPSFIKETVLDQKPHIKSAPLLLDSIIQFHQQVIQIKIKQRNSGVAHKLFINQMDRGQQNTLPKTPKTTHSSQQDMECSPNRSHFKT